MMAVRGWGVGGVCALLVLVGCGPGFEPEGASDALEQEALEGEESALRSSGPGGEREPSGSGRDSEPGISGRDSPGGGNFWVRQAEGAGDDAARAVAWSRDGSLVAVFTYEGRLDLGGLSVAGVLSSPMDFGVGVIRPRWEDGFILALPPDGARPAKPRPLFGNPFLVEDLIPGPEGSSPRELTEWDGTLFFAALGQIRTTDEYDLTTTLLWRSDGTAAGTHHLWAPTDFFSVLSMVEEPTPFGGKLFFRGADLYSGIELWASDGTSAGTRVFQLIQSGESGSHPGNFTPVGDMLFFTACQFPEVDPELGPGCELWKLESGASQAVLVRDIIPGSGHSSPQELTAFSDRLFFVANDAVQGFELWVSDGTAEGTVMVKDLEPGSASSAPRDLTVVGQQLFFVAYDAAHDLKLWVSDGTAGGTVMVMDIGMEDAVPFGLTAVGNTLFFTSDAGGAGRELWRSDGTPEGTVRVADIAPGSAGSQPLELTAAGGLLFFTADDGRHGRELWRSDGTAAGTTLVEDIRRGSGSGLPVDAELMAGPAGTVLFAADDGRTGLEPWVSDGRRGGTKRLADIAPGARSSNPREFTLSGDFVYFAADDGTSGTEPWAIPVRLRP
jgi:ELWxxDGT repeat protein